VTVADYSDYLSNLVARGGIDADASGSVEELSHPRKGYLMAVKKEPSELPIESIIQKMTGRARFGYM
jgi:hypothetical protein